MQTEATIADTDRLLIRRFLLKDADYILRQLNEDSFKRNISDKQVRDTAGAERYLREVPLASYGRHGFGLYHVLLKDHDIPIGICGLVKREELDFPDLGYAFLPEFWGQGYADEACRAVLNYATEAFGLGTVLAVTLPHNQGSIKVLLKLGFIEDATVLIQGRINNRYIYHAARKP